MSQKEMLHGLFRSPAHLSNDLVRFIFCQRRAQCSGSGILDGFSVDMDCHLERSVRCCGDLLGCPMGLQWNFLDAP